MKRINFQETGTQNGQTSEWDWYQTRVTISPYVQMDCLFMTRNMIYSVSSHFNGAKSTRADYWYVLFSYFIETNCSKFCSVVKWFLILVIVTPSNRRWVKLLPHANRWQVLGSIDWSWNVLFLPIDSHRRPDPTSTLFRTQTSNWLSNFSAKGKEIESIN